MPSPAFIQTPRVNQVSGMVVNAAMRVHSLLGPGLLESAYQACLAQELRKRGLTVETEVGLPVVYEGEKLDLGYRIDLLVDNLGDRGDQVRGNHPSCSRSPTLVLLAPKREERRTAN